MHMNWDVINVKVQSDTALHVRFQDGLEGEVQFLPSAFRGVFACLKDPQAFRLAHVQDGVLTWPGELDLAPDAMHDAIATHGKWVLD
ncbi:MAG: hypothetical protein RLZ81_1698 [Pseudomonadota bacterium]|jgi:hypothetical protein